MASLNPKPGSSTKDQHTTLVCAARRRGFNLAELRKAVGGSLRALSVAECSQWITHFTGRGLPNPPGMSRRKGADGPRRRSEPGVARMITPEHVEQIKRLLCEYFDGDKNRTLGWLFRNFLSHTRVTEKSRIDTVIRRLGTAKRAGEVIRVLKEMIHRRQNKAATAHRAATVRERT